MIYFLRRSDAAIKIGYTNNIRKRRVQLESSHGPLELLAWMHGGLPVEYGLHRRFIHLRIGAKEWFQPGDDLLAFISQEAQTPLPEHQHKSRLRMEVPAPLDLTGVEVRTRFVELVMKRQGVSTPAQIDRMQIMREAGISYPTVCAWLRGVDRFDGKVVIALCKWLQCSVGDLLYLHRG